MLATKMFETKNGLNPEFMKNIFNFIEPAYHLQSKDWIERHNIITVRYRSEIVSHIGAKIWKYLREEYKKMDPFLFLKEKFQVSKQMNVLVDYVKQIYKCVLNFI